VGKAIGGRAEGLALNATGREEARKLPERLSRMPIAAIYTSPLERAQQTAQPLAQALALTPRIEEGLDEIDFGTWTGRTFAELESDVAWAMWVYRRSSAEPPEGETIVTVQRRVVDAVERLRRAHPGETLALVSHGDVIKAALAHYLGMSLDHLESFDIAPASVSVVLAGDDWSKVTLVNGGAIALC
jgi:probable phosphoglycerate mutase